VIDGSRLKSDSGLMTGMQTNPGIRSRLFYGALQLDHISLPISKSLFKHSKENKPAFARKVKEKILWSFCIFSAPPHRCARTDTAQAEGRVEKVVLGVRKLAFAVF
jgi:hypothetical protein